jgi:RNA polymerase sigma-70 factor (ECF subfamily)
MEEAFRELYDRHLPYVRRAAIRLGVAEPALDDVCQEVFLHVYRQLPEFRGSSAFSTWLFGFVCNVVRTHKRSLRRKSVWHKSPGGIVDPEVLVDGGPDPFETASRREQLELAHRVVSKIKEDRREIYLLVEACGMTASEAASHTEADITTAYARLRGARKQVARARRFVRCVVPEGEVGLA